MNEKPEESKQGGNPLDAVRNIFGGIGEQLEPLKEKLHGNNAPKLIGLGLVILCLLIVLVILLAQNPWASLSRLNAVPTTPPPKDGYLALEGGLKDWGPGKNPPQVNDQTERHQEGNLSDPLKRILPVDKDPFMSKPLLPPEIELFREGEIRFVRPPRSSWTMEDITPFWAPIYPSIMKELRRVNHAEYKKLLEQEP